MKTKSLISLDREGLRDYFFAIQDFIDGEMDKGEDIDDFLDNTDLFDEFEMLLPDEEYPIFVIAILNTIRSEYIINRLLDVLEQSIQKNAVNASA